MHTDTIDRDRIEDRDSGLARDLRLIETRLIAATRAGLAGGIGGRRSGQRMRERWRHLVGQHGAAATTTTTTTTATQTTASCIVDPVEAADPYPADCTNSAARSTSNILTQSGIVRSDIRESFIGSTNVAAGVQMAFTMTLVNANSNCTPLAGYAIYLWHRDRSGDYSLYSAPAESYLRGVQVTDSNGRVTFTSIFPACCSGRHPHVHSRCSRTWRRR